MADAITLKRHSEARSESDASADERLAFERLLADLSSQFANLEGKQFEAATQTALLRIREFLGFDRSTFAEFLDDGSISVLCSNAIDGIDPVPVGRLPHDFFWYQRKLFAGETIILQSLPDDLPPEAAAETAHVRSVNLRAQVSIPLSIGGRSFGMIAFAAFSERRRWPHDTDHADQTDRRSNCSGARAQTCG